MMIAAAAFIGFGAVSCGDEKDPLPPVQGGENTGGENTGGDNTGGDNTDQSGELTVTVPVNLMLGVLEAEAEMPGDDILKFFDMTAEEFYKAMGSWEGAQGEGTTTQINNTIQFGLADGNDKDNLKFVPATSDNFGHWVNSDASLTWWTGQEEHGAFYCYTQSVVKWGLETPDAETLDYMWTYNVGSWAEEPAEGDKFKFTEVFYQDLGDAGEKLCYVEWDITFVGFIDEEASKYTGDPTSGSVAMDVDITEPVTFPLDKVQETFQLTKKQFNDAVNAGQITFALYIGEEQVEQSAGWAGVWFDADGKRTTWGEDTGATYFVEIITSPTALYANTGFYGETSYEAVKGKNIKDFKQVLTYTPAEGQSYTCDITWDIQF